MQGEEDDFMVILDTLEPGVEAGVAITLVGVPELDVGLPECCFAVLLVFAVELRFKLAGFEDALADVVCFGPPLTLMLVVEEVGFVLETEWGGTDLSCCAASTDCDLVRSTLTASFPSGMAAAVEGVGSVWLLL